MKFNWQSYIPGPIPLLTTDYPGDKFGTPEDVLGGILVLIVLLY